MVFVRRCVRRVCGYCGIVGLDRDGRRAMRMVALLLLHLDRRYRRILASRSGGEKGCGLWLDKAKRLRVCRRRCVRASCGAHVVRIRRNATKSFRSSIFVHDSALSLGAQTKKSLGWCAVVSDSRPCSGAGRLIKSPHARVMGC